MINATTVVVLDIIVGIVLSVCPRGMLGEFGHIQHRCPLPRKNRFHGSIHLKIGRTNSKLRHQTGIVIETIQEGVRPHIADLLHLGSKIEIGLFHQQI